MARFEYIVKNLKRANPRSVRRSVMLRIDGEVLNLGYVLSEDVLVQSLEEPGDYWLLTCGCGEPGCAGLFTPFEVEHLEDGIIHWHVTDPGPERDFYFSRDQAMRELQKAGLTPTPPKPLPPPLPPMENNNDD
ncbi:MAG: hypothetical protein Q8M07_29790 [Prosthecobacter sp.]|nr:hypothetical protein [Prosthecobacter sp.]